MTQGRLDEMSRQELIEEVRKLERLRAEAERVARELHVAEAKSSGIVSISADAIISVDLNQRITRFNEGAEKIFGYSKPEAIGAPLDMLIPERFRAAHRAHVRKFAAGPEAARRMGERGARIFGLRKNGEEFPADAAIAKLEVAGESILTVAVRDISELKRIEHERTLLAKIGPALAPTLDYEGTLTNLVQFAVRELADVAVLYTVDEQGELRRSRVASGDPARPWFDDLLRGLPVDDRRDHPVWQVMDTGRPVLMQLTDEMLPSFAQNDEHLRALRAISPRSVMGVPLTVDDRCVGALFLASSGTARPYGAEDLRLAEEVGRRAAVYMENARLHREAQRAIKARNEVLGVVAHDLRNPLAVILMQAKLLQPRREEPERRSRKPGDVIERPRAGWAASSTTCWR